MILGETAPRLLARSAGPDSRADFSAASQSYFLVSIPGFSVFFLLARWVTSVSTSSRELVVTLELAVQEAKIAGRRRRHLLDLESLSRTEIETILDTSESLVEVSQRRRRKLSTLKGKVVANLFFEPSTRTRTSFGLAAKRLSADTIDFSPGGSSLSKGETFIDPAKSLEAMGVVVVVVRHISPGAPLLLDKNLHCSVLNAGYGAHE